MNHPDESLIFEQVKKGNIKTFEVLFHRYYGFLCGYAEKFTQDRAIAEEIVQDFFVGFWEKREALKIDTSVKNYFFRSVKNRCLNYLQHQKTKAKYAQKVLSETEIRDSDDDVFVEIDLAQKIEESINSLPEKRKEIFRLSRQEGLKYTEIAKKLNISIKTVETHMSLAIKSLRDKLKIYKSLFLFF
jgi:RNA polymerase sigma-70 factor (ECF subfamily)